MAHRLDGIGLTIDLHKWNMAARHLTRVVKISQKLYHFFTDSFTGGGGGGWIWLDSVGLGWTGSDAHEFDKSDESDDVSGRLRAEISGANIGLVFHDFNFSF